MEKRSHLKNTFLNKHFIKLQTNSHKNVSFFSKIIWWLQLMEHTLFKVSIDDGEILLRPPSLGRLKADGADVFSREECWSQSVCQSNTWERNELHLCFNYDSITIQGNCQNCTFSEYETYHVLSFVNERRNPYI